MKTYLGICPGRGRGVFAGRRIHGGTRILRFRGRKVPASVVTDFERHLEIGDGWYLGPSGGADDYVNHSCEPNCGVFFTGRAPYLVAVRDIVPGDEITFDYSTVMLTDPTRFRCRCGAPSCRGVVEDYYALPDETRWDLARRGMVPAFVLNGGFANAAS